MPAPVIDIALVAVAAVDVRVVNMWDHTRLGVALAAVGCTALAFRRRFPLGVFLLTLPVALMQDVAVAVLAALFTLAERSRNRRLLAVCVALAAGASSTPWPLAEVDRTMTLVFLGQGARVATLTIPDIARVTPLARPLRPRLEALNHRVRAAAHRHGVVVADVTLYPVATDPRLWSQDRLHSSPLGHQRIAAALAHSLNLPDTDESWTHPLPVLSVGRARFLRAASAEARWVAGFLGPWIGRRARGRSSGDGRVAKRPDLLSVGSSGQRFGRAFQRGQEPSVDLADASE